MAKLFGGSDPQAMVTYTRPVFYSFLKIPFFFDLNTEQHLLFARMLFGFLAFLNFALIYRLVRDLGFDRISSHLYCGFLITFHVFFYNFYRVRSDFLSLFFFLIALHRILSPHKLKFKNIYFDPILPIVIFLLSLSTPKSLYFIVWLCLIYLYTEKNSKDRFTVIRNSLTILVLPAATLIISMQLLGLGIVGLGNVHAQLLSYYISSFKNSLQYDHWVPIVVSLKINFLNYFAIIAGVVIYVFNKSLHERKNKIIILLFSLSLVCLLIHPERWEYFIAHILPFLALPILFLINYLKKKRWQLISSSLFLVWMPLHMTYYSGWWFSNRNQIDIAKEISFIMAHFPNWNIFDATGIDPRSNNYLWFLGPSDPIGNLNTVIALGVDQPEVILSTPKFEFGGPQLIVLLYKEYSELRPGFWVRKRNIDEFNNVNFPDWSYHLGLPFIYDHRPRTRF